MKHSLKGAKLVVASHNKGKVREIAALLAPFGIETVSAGELGLPEPEETGSTFQANAELKALAAARASNLIALADDSGLAVNALGGDPGIYSARWAGETKDFGLAMQKVEDALQKAGSNDRSAAFICGLCVAWPPSEGEEGKTAYFEGRVAGTLTWPPRGTHGFGYDPVFVADGYDITFGEMAPDAKHAISHRADAFRQLTDAIAFD
ncbi:MAG: RdgB/HAM1 family non-canonical purine NTP pyrophosphatase [Alphaproteobacteria bacterium]|nr:RdgB/HAM1 family non-canonical purine NTP pyrophosphatase [Alphaproteobacteria bacterium]MBO6626896.1 RdgB/HAM1 family non-canonical purine NTP pyrophosphatase [Alphaproteobacteria bacterium]MDF1627663.1 RdgB/HAM1 family non-canonical purine NTP pyrophosphatase [Parvibaculaceae bacterium]